MPKKIVMPSSTYRARIAELEEYEEIKPPDHREKRVKVSFEILPPSEFEGIVLQRSHIKPILLTKSEGRNESVMHSLCRAVLNLSEKETVRAYNMDDVRNLILHAIILIDVEKCSSTTAPYNKVVGFHPDDVPKNKK